MKERRQTSVGDPGVVSSGTSAMLTNRKAWVAVLVLAATAAASSDPIFDGALPCDPSLAVLDAAVVDGVVAADHVGAHHYTPQEQQWLNLRISELLDQNYDAQLAARVAELEIHSPDNLWGFFHMIRSVKNVFNPQALFKRDNETSLTGFGNFFSISTPATPSLGFGNFGQLSESATTLSTPATPLASLDNQQSTPATPGQSPLRTTSSEPTGDDDTLETTASETLLDEGFASPSTLLFPTTSSTTTSSSLSATPTSSETTSLRDQDTSSSTRDTTSSTSTRLTRDLTSLSDEPQTLSDPNESTVQLTAEDTLTSTGTDPSSSDQTTLSPLETSTDNTALLTTLDDPLLTLDFISRVVTTLLGLVVTVTLTYQSSPSSAPNGNNNKEKLGGGLSESNKIVVGVVVGVGGALIIGVIALLFYLRKRRHQEHELGKWTFWKKEGKGTDEFLTGELGVRDRNINQGSNF